MNPQSKEQGTQTLPGGSFRLLVQKLGYQAMMGLGVVENPVTQERQVNLEQARMVIEDLRMLHEKTQGNLEAEEAEHLAGILEELDKKLEDLGE